MIRAETLFTPGLKFTDDKPTLKITHVYNDGYADLTTKLWLCRPDDFRGKLVICPRCHAAVRLLVGAPNNRGLCCQGCKSRLTHKENERFDRATGGLMERRQNAQKPVKSGAGKPTPRKPLVLPAKREKRRKAA